MGKQARLRAARNKGSRSNRITKIKDDGWLRALPEKFFCVYPESIRQQLESVLEDYPTLNPYGFVSVSVAFRREPKETDVKSSDFLEYADSYIPMIVLCRQWLQEHPLGAGSA